MEKKPRFAANRTEGAYATEANCRLLVFSLQALRDDSLRGPVMCRSPHMLPKNLVPACVRKNLTVDLQPYDEHDARGKSEQFCTFYAFC